MSMQLLFVGYILEAQPGYAGGDEETQRKREIDLVIKQRTDQVLGALPEEDGWLPICKPMFNCPPDYWHGITYWQRLVHFGASMKNVDFLLRDWLDKFEALLRQLYWQEAYLRIEHGYLGTHEFRWKPKQDWLDALFSGRLLPITAWDFTTTLDHLDELREREQR